MANKSYKKIREKLEEEKQRIENALRSVSRKDDSEHAVGDYEASFPNYGDDPAAELEDNSPNEVADFQTNLSVTSDLVEELDRIDAALERLDGHAYGKCDKCAQDIPIERLEAYPAATTCITCAKKNN